MATSIPGQLSSTDAHHPPSPVPEWVVLVAVASYTTSSENVVRKIRRGFSGKMPAPQPQQVIVVAQCVVHDIRFVIPVFSTDQATGQIESGCGCSIDHGVFGNQSVVDDVYPVRADIRRTFFMVVICNVTALQQDEQRSQAGAEANYNSPSYSEGLHRLSSVAASRLVYAR
jgi:hypothetical protein